MQALELAHAHLYEAAQFLRSKSAPTDAQVGRIELWRKQRLVGGPVVRVAPVGPLYPGWVLPSILFRHPILTTDGTLWWPQHIKVKSVPIEHLFSVFRPKNIDHRFRLIDPPGEKVQFFEPVDFTQIMAAIGSPSADHMYGHTNRAHREVRVAFPAAGIDRATGTRLKHYGDPYVKFVYKERGDVLSPPPVTGDLDSVYIANEYDSDIDWANLVETIGRCVAYISAKNRP